MFIKKVEIEKYKVLENISINFEEKQNHNVFPVISINGGGKSTLLQFIFTFLHCSFVENRQKYLKTLLEYYKEPKNKNELNKIVSFELEHEKKTIKIDYFHCKNDYKKLNFNSIIELKELKDRKEKVYQSFKDIELLNNLENDIKKSNIPSQLVWRELERFVTNNKEIELLRRNETAFQLNFIDKTRKRIENTIISDDELNTLIIKAETEKNRLVDELQKSDLQYAFHFNKNSDVLLFKSNVNVELLSQISNRIYLASPNTQVLQFLEDEQLSSLFKNEKYIYSSYEHSLRKCQEDLQGLFTYDFSTINLIIEALAKAKNDDFKILLETDAYGDRVKATLKEFSNLLTGKSITIDDNNLNVVKFKTSNSKIALTPKDLSHGELKKLSIYIWLKAKTNNNSIILMDEVDMGLHPIWQYELYSDLQNWSIGNQFILATHSPQIISNAHYRNLVVIKHTETGATSEQFNQAPLESDLNTIVKTIMGGDYIPKELSVLRKKYRKLFENNKLETKEAKEIKEKILAYESENSSFFQDIKFQIELRK